MGFYSIDYEYFKKGKTEPEKVLTGFFIKIIIEDYLEKYRMSYQNQNLRTKRIAG